MRGVTQLFALNSTEDASFKSGIIHCNNNGCTALSQPVIFSIIGSIGIVVASFMLYGFAKMNFKYQEIKMAEESKIKSAEALKAIAALQANKKDENTTVIRSKSRLWNYIGPCWETYIAPYWDNITLVAKVVNIGFIIWSFKKK